MQRHRHLKLVPFLSRYWWHSNKSRHEVIARAYAPLIENSITEHQDLIQAAKADHLIRKDGWMEIFRTTAKRDTELAEAARLAREYGVSYRALNREELAKEEPHIRGDFVGGLKWNDPWSVTNPHGLTQAYLTYFHRSVDASSRVMRHHLKSAHPARAGGCVDR